jgi:hypothetical protein
VQTSNIETLLRHAAHAVPNNNSAVDCYSCDGTGCACQLEQFFTAFERALCNFFPAPNGWRYPLVGGTRQRHFDGTNFKPHKVPENAQTPTSRVHALLGSF